MLAVLAGNDLQAQEKLVSTRAAGVSTSFESISFANDGLVQLGFDGVDTVRIASVRQLSVPMTFATALRGSWKLDVTTLYASGMVRYRTSTGGAMREASLSGISDVRVRATGALIGEALYLTIGANLPAGRTSLTSAEFSALRILAAPALGIASSPVGAGASGTLGLVYARVVGGWSVAAGASYEHRGRFQPVAAFIAGSPSADFKPGAVVRASLSADRIVGAHRLFVALTSDQFASDRLTGVGATAEASTPNDLATVRLGPVYSAEAQMQLAVPAFRELLAYTSFRWRSPYEREGERVDGSSGQYLEAGARGAIGLRPMMSLVVAADGRVHSGLGVDQGLPTFGVASAGVMGALDVRRGRWSMQPNVKVQAGSLEQRNALVPGTQSFRGVGAGITVVTRF